MPNQRATRAPHHDEGGAPTTLARRHVAPRTRRGALSTGTEVRCRQRECARANRWHAPIASFPIHDVKQRSLLPSRDALLRPGFAFSLSTPTRGAGGAPTGALFRWSRASARGRQRLARRGASRSGGTLASRRSTVAISGRGPRFHLRHFLRIRTANSSQPGRSAWRAGSRTSRGHRLRAAAAGRHSPLRLQDRLRRRPSMSEDGQNVATLRTVVNSNIRIVVTKSGQA